MDQEIHVLHARFVKFYRIFTCFATLGFIFPPGTEDWPIRRLLIPLLGLITKGFCIHTALTTKNQMTFLYSVIYIGALYQMLFKYYVVFIGHKEDFGRLLDYMESLLKEENLPFADEIRRKRLKKNMNLAFFCLKVIYVFSNTVGVFLALLGITETKCCALFCRIPEQILSLDKPLSDPVNLIFSSIVFFVMSEIILVSDYFFIPILAYFEGELSAIKEIIQHLNDSETVARNSKEILKFVYKAHREVLRHLRILSDIYWHLNLQVILTIFLYICLLLFMARFNEVSITTYMASISATVQLFLLCFFGQILRNRTEAIGQALYHTRWYEMRHQEQVALLIIMNPAQQAIGLEAGGIMNLSFQTFANVMRTAISYAAILYTVMNE